MLMDPVGRVCSIRDLQRVLAILKDLFPRALTVQLANIINAIDALCSKLCASSSRQAHLKGVNEEHGCLRYSENRGEVDWMF